MTVRRDCQALSKRGVPCRAQVAGDNVYCRAHGGHWVPTPVSYECGAPLEPTHGRRGMSCRRRVWTQGTRCPWHAPKVDAAAALPRACSPNAHLCCRPRDNGVSGPASDDERYMADCGRMLQAALAWCTAQPCAQLTFQEVDRNVAVMVIGSLSDEHVLNWLGCSHDARTLLRAMNAAVEGRATVLMASMVLDKLFTGEAQS